MESPRHGNATERLRRPVSTRASAGDENEENGEYAGNHRQRKQPASDELPSRQSEQKEVQRLAKNRVHDAASGAGRVPKERERRPLRHHAGAGCSGNGERNAKRDEAQDRLNRQLHRLSADENRVAARQIRAGAPASEPGTIRTE